MNLFYSCICQFSIDVFHHWIYMVPFNMLGLELFNFTFHSLTRLWKGIIDSTKNDSFNFISKCKIWQTFDFVYTAIRHIYFCCWQNCCSRFTLSACWFRKNMSCIFHPILQILFQFHHMLHLMTYISIQSLVKGETFRVNLGFLSDPIIPGVWMSLCFETLFYTVYSHLTLVHVGPNKVLAGVFRLKCF